jgi:hypothetical protein
MIKSWDECTCEGFESGEAVAEYVLTSSLLGESS